MLNISRFANTVFIVKSKVKLHNLFRSSVTVLNTVTIVRLNFTVFRGWVVRVRGRDLDAVNFDVFDKTELLIGIELASRVLLLLIYSGASTADFGNNVFCLTLEVRVVET